MATRIIEHRDSAEKISRNVHQRMGESTSDVRKPHSRIMSKEKPQIQLGQYKDCQDRGLLATGLQESDWFASGVKEVITTCQHNITIGKPSWTEMSEDYPLHHLQTTHQKQPEKGMQMRHQEGRRDRRHHFCLTTPPPWEQLQDVTQRITWSSWDEGQQKNRMVAGLQSFTRKLKSR